MSDVPAPSSLSCSGCGNQLSADERFCPACGVARGSTAPVPRPVAAAAPTPVVAIAPKSAGLAVFLTFLWLGAGHLYVNRVTSGIILLVVDLMLWVLMWTFFGIVVAFPLWLVLFVIAAIRVAGHTTDHNRRLFAQ